MNPVEVLNFNNIKPSYPRIKILDFLMNNLIHPTVEDIYEALNIDMPTLSKTTVYNTLKLFKSNGIVLSLSIDDIESRYDINTSDHGHFQCKICGEIVDIEMDIIPTKQLESQGFVVQEKSCFIKGICNKCAH